MSYPIYDLYSRELNKNKLLSEILLYEFDHITKNRGKCLITISFFQPGFMGSKVK
jgi:hypothetical protein